MAKDISYREAKEELEAIAHQIENEEPDIDELSALVKRAKELIQICKKKLNKAGDDIEDALKELDD